MSLIEYSEAVESKLVKLETSRTVILCPVVSVLCVIIWTIKFPLCIAVVEADFTLVKVLATDDDDDSADRERRKLKNKFSKLLNKLRCKVSISARS